MAYVNIQQVDTGAIQSALDAIADEVKELEDRIGELEEERDRALERVEELEDEVAEPEAQLEEA